MKSRKYAVNLYLSFVLLSLAIVLGLSGCDQQRLAFMAIPNRSVLALSADDVVQVMSRAGFSDEQIIKFGPGLRSALLNSGACQVRQGEVVHAVFAVQGDYVHVATKMRGSFIYNAEKNGLQSEFRAQKPEDKQPLAAPADNSVSPLLKTQPTGNTAPKLQFFNG
jgi:hypothetical protein